MQTKLFLFLATISLVGCATTAPVINAVPQKVEIPISVACSTSVPIKPDFNFDKLTVDQDIYVKNRALLADRKLWQGYSTELLAALNSCTK